MSIEPDEFEVWISILRHDVIEYKYEYEPGEFTVYPELWRPLFDEGLTAEQAFERALASFAKDRDEEVINEDDDVAITQVLQENNP